MMKKIDELNDKKQYRDPTTPESLEIKRQFWEKMRVHFDNLNKMLEQWKKEDEDNRNNRHG